MSDFSSDFKSALPHVIKWSVGENKFAEDKLDEDGNPKFPKSLALFIPVESITALTDHLMNLADQKQVAGKVWDYDNNVEVELKGVYLNAPGKRGEFGDFGNLNPNSLAPSADNTPF